MKTASKQSEELVAVLPVPRPGFQRVECTRLCACGGGLGTLGLGPQWNKPPLRIPRYSVSLGSACGASQKARTCGFASAWISNFSSAPQNRNLTGHRGHLPAHGLDVRFVVQALRVVGHVVAQLEQTVRKALKDRIALACCSHGLHQVRYGEEGTPVSSREVLPCSLTARPPPNSARLLPIVGSVSTSAQPRGATLLQVNKSCGPRTTDLHSPTRLLLTVGVSAGVARGGWLVVGGPR